MLNNQNSHAGPQPVPDTLKVGAQPQVLELEPSHKQELQEDDGGPLLLTLLMGITTTIPMRLPSQHPRRSETSFRSKPGLMSWSSSRAANQSYRKVLTALCELYIPAYLTLYLYCL